MTIDKRALLDALRRNLSAEIARGTTAAKDAAAAATHEENKAEGDKDMRSTEASYIARGQAERVRELETALAKLSAMPVREFSATDPIAASAIVELDDGKKSVTYFLVTAAGGIRLDGLLTLATTSPLGSALLGLSQGDDAEGPGGRSYSIARVR